MSIAKDLLEQAIMLSKLGAGRPKQVHLRRAISSAYYAIFHLLTGEAARLFIRDDLDLSARVNRTFDHTPMKFVSQKFANSQLPNRLHSSGIWVISSDLQQVAKAFVSLQQARHSADYDMTLTFRRDEANGLIEEAVSAFAAWERVRQTDEVRLYLACFLLWDTWDKKQR